MEQLLENIQENCQQVQALKPEQNTARARRNPKRKGKECQVLVLIASTLNEYSRPRLSNRSANRGSLLCLLYARSRSSITLNSNSRRHRSLWESD
jgi:hypothetical protein